MGSKFWIEGPVGNIEAELRLTPAIRALAIVAHPHPLMGGTMQNAVVFHTHRELSRAGFGAVRFNFRGVGASDGSHDEGRGEREDLAAVAAWCRRALPGHPILVAGYSFGAWCAFGLAVEARAFDALVGIGLPVRTHPLDDFIEHIRMPVAAVQAEQDAFGSPQEVEACLSRAPQFTGIETVAGVGHGFEGVARDVGERCALLGTKLIEDLRVGSE